MSSELVDQTVRCPVIPTKTANQSNHQTQTPWPPQPPSHRGVWVKSDSLQGVLCVLLQLTEESYLKLVSDKQQLETDRNVDRKVCIYFHVIVVSHRGVTLLVRLVNQPGVWFC